MKSYSLKKSVFCLVAIVILQSYYTEFVELITYQRFEYILYRLLLTLPIFH